MQEENAIHKKYGLPTAMSMVIGTVIGSGIFFKASRVLQSNGGNMVKSLITVAAVGLIMLVCAYVFSILASRIDKVNGLVDYAEAACGEGYAYSVGWFCTTVFYPTITSCLAWISANYIMILFNIQDGGFIHFALAASLLIFSFLFNYFTPAISGKFQVSTTVIKLVPLLIMAVIGTVMGIANGTTLENFYSHSSDSGGGIFSAIVSFAFAYEGWIFATTINAEIKDSKKNLPRALVLGAFVIIAVYVLYFVGLMSVLSIDEIMEAGDDLPRVAFSSLFGSPLFGTVAYVFVIISCLGTLNGLMLVSTRGMYSIAIRGHGPAPELFSTVSKKTDMPFYSALFALLITLLWLMQWELGFIKGILPDFLSFETTTESMV